MWCGRANEPLRQLKARQRTGGGCATGGKRAKSCRSRAKAMSGDRTVLRIASQGFSRFEVAIFEATMEPRRSFVAHVLRQRGGVEEWPMRRQVADVPMASTRQWPSPAVRLFSDNTSMGQQAFFGAACTL
jgi:hypothetical protein